VSEGLLESSFGELARSRSFRFVYLQLAHDWGANGSLANRTADVKICLFTFEIKELSQAEAARL
jgi:hypothetical protein